MDRDSIFSAAFRATLKEACVKALRTPPSAPNCNAFIERFIASVRREVTNRMLFFGADSLRRSLADSCAHYRSERPHPSKGNDLLAPNADAGLSTGRIVRRERLGGLLSFYYRRVA